MYIYVSCSNHHFFYIVNFILSFYFLFLKPFFFSLLSFCYCIDVKSVTHCMTELAISVCVFYAKYEHYYIMVWYYATAFLCLTNVLIILFYTFN